MNGFRKISWLAGSVAAALTMAGGGVATAQQNVTVPGSRDFPESTPRPPTARCS